MTTSNHITGFQEKSLSVPDNPIYDPSIFGACARLFQTRHVIEYFQAKTGKYPYPLFKTVHVAKEIPRVIITIASNWRENMLG